MGTSPDVLRVLLERALEETQDAGKRLREQAREIQSLRERVLSVEHDVKAQADRRHDLADRLQGILGNLQADIGELKSATAADDSQVHPTLSPSERESAAVLSWVGKHWQGLAALAALVAWLLSMLGVDLPGLGEAPTVRDELRAEQTDGIAPGDSFTYGSE